MKKCKECQVKVQSDLILCSDCKKKRDKLYRENNETYAQKYSKYYYLKKQLENPNYNKERWEKEKNKKLNNNYVKLG